MNVKKNVVFAVHKTGKFSTAEAEERADAFLKEGKDNDIYDYVTSIFSEEWGPHDYANLIDDKDEIVIVFSQFGTDTNVNSGVVGYYWKLWGLPQRKENLPLRKIPLTAYAEKQITES